MPTPTGSPARGCAKPLAIVVGGFFVMVGLIASCTPEVREVEVQGPETTVTVTKSPSTVTKTTTATTTVSPTPEDNPEPVEEPTSEDTVMRGFAGAAAGIGAGAAAPSPAPAPAPAPAATYYANCADVRAAGAAPLYAGSPGYSTKLDRDRDGVACE